MSSIEQAREALTKAWTDFLDANPDDLTSPDDLPNHALMTGDQFVQYASAAFARLSPTTPVDGAKARAIETIRDLVSWLQEDPDNIHFLPPTDVRFLRDWIDGKATPVDGVGAEPRVKPLEWVESEEHGFEIWTAQTPFGPYTALPKIGSCPLKGPDVRRQYANLEAAKAAAQADYERRILSALASPEAEARLREGVEPIKAHPAEARVSIIARQIRETMRGYGHKVAESSLPDWIAVDVSAALKAAEAVEDCIRAEARLAQAEGGMKVTEASTAARFTRLHSIVARIRWIEASTPAFEDAQTKQAFDDLAEYLFAAGIDAALHPQSAAGEEGKP